MTASEIMTILIHFLALNQHLSGFLILTMHLAGRIAWAASIKNDTVTFLLTRCCLVSKKRISW